MSFDILLQKNLLSEDYTQFINNLIAYPAGFQHQDLNASQGIIRNVAYWLNGVNPLSANDYLKFFNKQEEIIQVLGQIINDLSQKLIERNPGSLTPEIFGEILIDLRSSYNPKKTLDSTKIMAYRQIMEQDYLYLLFIRNFIGTLFSEWSLSGGVNTIRPKDGLDEEIVLTIIQEVVGFVSEKLEW